MSKCCACLVCGSLLGIYALVLTIAILLRAPEIDLFDVRVENGTLYTLGMDTAGTSTLDYNLSAVFSVRSIGTDDKYRVAKLAVTPSYHSQQLGRPGGSRPPFELRQVEMTTVLLDVQGREQVTAVPVVAKAYAEDAARGYYSIEAKLQLDTDNKQWCDASCTLYFGVPTAARGAPNIFDGDDCWMKCTRGGLHRSVKEKD